MKRIVIVGTFIYLILISFVFGSSLVWAEYPERPIRMITGWPVGGSGDLPLRSLCEPVAKALKQPIIVENITGAGSVKALAIVSNAAPDGYTLGFTFSGVLTTRPHVMEVPYDSLKGFTPIAITGWCTYGLVVRGDSPWKNLNQFIEYAKINPGKIKYGTSAFKSSTHIFAEQFQAKAGFKMVLVPFEGGIKVMTALVGGHIQAGFMPAECKPYLETGELRMLAALNSQRWESFPDIPTLEELGYPFALESGLIILAPPSLPTTIRTKLQESFREATKSVGYIKTSKMFENIIDYMSGAELETYLRKTYEADGQVVKGLFK